jgi:hypothetical protein
VFSCVSSLSLSFLVLVLFISLNASIAISSALRRVELLVLWTFSDPKRRNPTVVDCNELVVRVTTVATLAGALAHYDRRAALSELAFFLTEPRPLPAVALLSDAQRTAVFALHPDLNRLMTSVWPVAFGLGTRTLFRADYENRRGTHESNGIVAKNPDNTINTAQDHIADGTLATRFISFTTALPVAVMYWASDFCCQQKDRVLLEVTLTNPRFLIWDIVVRDLLPRGREQARVVLDREVIVEPACRALDGAVIQAEFDCRACYNENPTFRTVGFMIAYRKT